tara:strand:- start:387 stop:722 length:336 start_codon:yes stop_codon:yes gene_type:complete
VANQYHFKKIGVKMSEKKPSAVAQTEEQLHTNPMLSMIVEKDSELKDYLVEFAGKKFDKEEVTVNMIAEVMAMDFPEFMYPLAEENFLLGYKQGLDDAETLYNRKTEQSEE